MNFWLHIAGYVLIGVGTGLAAVPGLDHVGQAIVGLGTALSATTGIQAINAANKQ